MLLGSRVTQTMDLFDHKTIQFEGGPSLAFYLIKKACQRNKHLKMKLTPLLEFPKHRITLILVETAKRTGKHAEKRKVGRITNCMGRAQCNQASSDILDAAKKHLHKIALLV